MACSIQVSPFQSKSLQKAFEMENLWKLGIISILILVCIIVQQFLEWPNTIGIVEQSKEMASTYQYQLY